MSMIHHLAPKSESVLKYKTGGTIRSEAMTMITTIITVFW